MPILSCFPYPRGASSSSGASTPLDPQEVYKNTRPADWLPMPTPQDDEMYLLFHIPDGVSSLIAFTATCASAYTVETGTVVNGEFVPREGLGEAPIFESGAKYEAELHADDYGDLTSDGFKQVMIRVLGEGILTWNPSIHSKKTSPSNFSNWNIMEIGCNLPSSTKVGCGNSNVNSALAKLRYYTQYGINSITNMNSMFNNCPSLTAIPQLDTSEVTNMNGMFNNCRSLIAIPQLHTSNVTSMSHMFYSCQSLTAIPQLDTSKVTDMSCMFNYCNSLTVIPQLNTSKVTDMNSMFSDCTSLTTIPQLDTSKAILTNNMFTNCVSLTTIPQLNTPNVTNMSNMCNNCRSLTAIPQLDTSEVTNMNGMFNNCPSLTAIPQLNTSKVTNMGSMFSNCYSLACIKLNPIVTGWVGYAISLSQCSLGHTAIVELFNSLPTITSSKAITLIGNPGVAELTDTEKAIATGKNWTLTL